MWSRVEGGGVGMGRVSRGGTGAGKVWWVVFGQEGGREGCGNVWGKGTRKVLLSLSLSLYWGQMRVSAPESPPPPPSPVTDSS